MAPEALTWVDVGPADLLPGECRTAEARHMNVALFNVNGTWHALENVCTHDGGELAGGAFEGTVVTCPRHGAQFDVITGKALCFPAVTPAPVLPVRVDNGRVLVALPD